MVARRAMDLLLLVAGGHDATSGECPPMAAPPERLTHGAAGAFACESADGKSLLFQPKDADSPLMAMALTGGQARQLIACVKNSAFGVGPRGVYYVPCDPSPDPPVYLLDPKTGRNRAPRHIGRIISAPAGAQCVARRQHNRVPEAGALTRRPDVDRELPVMVGRAISGHEWTASEPPALTALREPAVAPSCA